MIAHAIHIDARHPDHGPTTSPRDPHALGAVTAALWTGQRAWPMGALIYLLEAWISDRARRATARIPATVVLQEKRRLALTLVRLTRAAGVTLTAVVADAE